MMSYMTNMLAPMEALPSDQLASTAWLTLSGCSGTEYIMASYTYFHEQEENVLLDIEKLIQKLKDPNLSPSERRSIVDQLDKRGGVWKREEQLFSSLRSQTLFDWKRTRESRG